MKNMLNDAFSSGDENQSLVQKQSEKMESLGLLAGGLAQGRSVDDNLRLILHSGEKAKALINQVLSFSSLDPSLKSSCYLTPIIKELAILLQSSLGSAIELECRFLKETHPLYISPVNIHRIITNLILNAAQAMKNGFSAYFMKPLDLKRLTNTIRRLLDD
ncbi:MAG: hypothetical protein PF447_00130 [Spirochaetaceae bacterium]|nr:hypothetical protein [Spirochaetaceae bacterium]